MIRITSIFINNISTIVSSKPRRIRFQLYFRKHFKTLNNLVTIKKTLYLTTNFFLYVSIILPSSVNWSVCQNNVDYTNAKSNYRCITYILLNILFLNESPKSILFLKILVFCYLFFQFGTQTLILLSIPFYFIRSFVI